MIIMDPVCHERRQKSSRGSQDFSPKARVRWYLVRNVWFYHSRELIYHGQSIIFLLDALSWSNSSNCCHIISLVFSCTQTDRHINIDKSLSFPFPCIVLHEMDADGEKNYYFSERSLIRDLEVLTKPEEETERGSELLSSLVTVVECSKLLTRKKQWKLAGWD